MTWNDYRIGGTVSKAKEDVTLWDMEKGLVEISKSTLATSITLDDRRRGYVFHGRGRLLLDAIVETEEGAVGRSIEKQLIRPFLMFGDTEKIQTNLAEANEEDFEEKGYENQEGFLAEAEKLCDRFLKKGSRDHESFKADSGVIFAFQEENTELDLLVAEGSKLVYTAEDLTFVSEGGRVVLAIPGEVVCSNNGKSIIVKNDRSIIIRK
ncbi:MAG: hypothetical protein ACETWE_13685 [Candidatus Bathyarchaeia archaeon]